MFEKMDESIIPFSRFVFRVFIHFCIGWAVISIALCIGIVGFHYYESMEWLDAFENSAMILSTMGPVIPVKTDPGKLFSAFYALFSGLVFVTMMGVIFAPIVHRFLHKFHSGHARR